MPLHAQETNATIGSVSDTTTDSVCGKIGTDAEMADRSLYDILVGGGPATFPTAAAPANDVSLGAVLRYIADAQLGTAGIASFPSAAAAANNVSIAEVIRYIQNSLLADSGTYVPGLGFKVSKTEDVNTATSDDLFTVTGKVLITLWTGEVTNALDAAVSDYKLRVKTSNIDLCAASNIASAAIGFMFQMNSDAGDTLINTASATETADTNGKGLANRVVGKAGGTLTLEALRTAGAAGDAIIHTLWYLPLEASAAVAAAA